MCLSPDALLLLSVVAPFRLVVTCFSCFSTEHKCTSHECTDFWRSIICIKGRILRRIHQPTGFFTLSLRAFPLPCCCCVLPLGLGLSVLTHVSRHFRPARLFSLSYCCAVHQPWFHAFHMCISPAALLFLSAVAVLRSLVAYSRASTFSTSTPFSLSYCSVVLCDHAINHSCARECVVCLPAHRHGRSLITSAQQA